MEDFETDYTYFEELTQQFKNVNIKLKVEDDMFKININSEEEIQDKDILTILKQLNDNFMKKLRISLIEDCNIYITNKNITEKIELSYGDFFIKDRIK